MAREVTETLIDDLDGGKAAETVTFGLDGTMYEIDLSNKNATALRKSVARFIKAGRPSSSPARSTRRKAASSTNGSKPKRDFDITQLREWAGTNKVAIPSRGRIPQAVVDQYKQAGGR
jgi:nucleoid-associated protein Lsr2